MVAIQKLPVLFDGWEPTGYSVVVLLLCLATNFEEAVAALLVHHEQRVGRAVGSGQRHRQPAAYYLQKHQPHKTFAILEARMATHGINPMYKSCLRRRLSAPAA